MQHFTAADGARIAYADHGSGRPLLLLHGLMAHSGFFEKQAPLAEDFRLIAPDLRGHGASRDAGGTVSVEQLADDIATMVETLDLTGIIGVGWSLGASVLWHVLNGPAAQRFAASVVIDMTPCVRNRSDWQLGLSAEVCAARTTAIREDFPAFAGAAGRNIFAQPIGIAAEPLASWSSSQFAANDPAAIGSLWASLVDQDQRPLLRSIEQPALIVRGTGSQLYGAGTADYLSSALPRARTIEFAEAGHAPHLEQAELFNDTIRQFAAGLPRLRENQTSI